MGDALNCNYCGVLRSHRTLDPIYFRKYHLCADKVWTDFQIARLAAVRMYDAMRAQLTDTALEPSTKLLTLKFLLYSFLVNPLEIVKKLYVPKSEYKPLIDDINKTPKHARTIYIENGGESKRKYDKLTDYYEYMNAIGKVAEDLYFRELNSLDSLDSKGDFKVYEKMDILRNSSAHADIWVETNSKIFFKDTHPKGNPVRILTFSSDEPLGRTCWDKAAAFLDNLKDYFEASHFSEE